MLYLRDMRNLHDHIHVNIQNTCIQSLNINLRFNILHIKGEFLEFDFSCGRESHVHDVALQS